MSAPRRLGPLATASALALGIAAAAVAGSGGLDPTFGVNGRVSLSPFVESYASSIAVQPDGKLVLAGTADDEAPPPPPPPAPEGLRSSNPDFLAVRLMPNGSIDQTFGAGGAVRTPVVAGAQPWEGASAVAVGADGSIAVAGFAATATGTDLAIVRYTSSGALDPTFSGDGIRTLDLGQSDGANGVSVQPDGKLVVVGRGASGFTVLRLLANGQLDPSFASGGVATSTLADPSLEDEASAVLLRGDKIVVGGTADTTNPSRSRIAVVRYLANGRLDQSFGTGGIVIAQGQGDRAWALAAAPEGKIVVVGRNGASQYRVVRLLADGRLDHSFGGSGVVETRFEGLAANALGVAVQADGKIVAAGTGLSYNESAFTAARYRDDGELDPSFGSGGKAVYDLPTIRLWGAGMAIQRSLDPQAAGRLVIAGQTFEGTADHIVALGIDLGELEAPPPPIRCVVPRVVRLTIAKARRKIRRANCSVGRVRRVKARRLRGIVIRQSPRAGRRLRRGARVNLVVGR